MDLTYLKRMTDAIKAKTLVKTLHIDRLLICKTRMKELKALSNLSTVFVRWSGTSTLLKFLPFDQSIPSILQNLIQHQRQLRYCVMLDIGNEDCTGNLSRAYVKLASSVNFEIEEIVGFECPHKTYHYRGMKPGHRIVLEWKSLVTEGKGGVITL